MENDLTKDEQKEIFNELLNTLIESLQKRFVKIPDNWNGVEIRQWITDYCTANLSMDRQLTGKRRKDYENTILVKYLT